MRLLDRTSKTVEMVDFVTEQLRILAKSGRDYIYIDSLDRIIEDIFEVKNFAKSLLKLRYAEQRIKVINKIGLETLFSMVNNRREFDLLIDLVGVNFTLVELKKEIKKLKKAERKYKFEEKKFKFLFKRYDTAIKLLRKKYAKEASTSYKKVFKSLNAFVESDGFTYSDYDEYSDTMDYDYYDYYENNYYDDDEDYDTYRTDFDRFVANNSHRYYNDRPQSRNKTNNQHQNKRERDYLSELYGDDDYDDLTYDEDVEDTKYKKVLENNDAEIMSYLDNIEDRLDAISGKIQILYNTGIGGKISQSDILKAEEETRAKSVNAKKSDMDNLMRAVQMSVMESAKTNKILSQYIMSQYDDDDDTYRNYEPAQKPIDINQMAYSETNHIEDYYDDDDYSGPTVSREEFFRLMNDFGDSTTSNSSPSSPVINSASVENTTVVQINEAENTEQISIPAE